MLGSGKKTKTKQTMELRLFKAQMIKLNGETHLLNAETVCGSLKTNTSPVIHC